MAAVRSAYRCVGAATFHRLRLVPTTHLSRPASTTAQPHRTEFDLSALKGRHLPDLFTLTPTQLSDLVALSIALKRLHAAGVTYQPLHGRTMSMIFQKRSTRTRVSTETGMARLGGHALFLSTDDIQLGKNESIRDTAAVLSRYNDVILARVYGHDTITQLCAHATVPVINALSDTHHPLQV